MIVAGPERFAIARPLDVQTAVLRCQRSTLLHGASDLERSVIATIVSELGSNVLKYAERGTLELRRLRRGAVLEVEVTARDEGPGIQDVALALTDHYSSGRSLGLGLPGVRRMSDDVVIEPTPGGGTTVRVRKRLAAATSDLDVVAAGRPATAPPVVASGRFWRAGVVVRPRPGQRVSGDQAIVVERDRHVLVTIVDATGHGPLAHALARDLVERVRVRFLAASEPTDVAGLLSDLHEACVGTAGAAAGVAVLDREGDLLQYLAVGNVRAALARPNRFTGVARDGMLGRRWPTPFVQTTPITPGDLLVAWTDGLPEGLARGGGHAWVADQASVDEGRLAERLVTEAAKLHDDAACVVLRWRP